MEELKKSKAQESIFTMSEGDDDEGEHTNPILSPDLTTSLNISPEPRIEVQVPTVAEPKPLQEIGAHAFGTNIEQTTFDTPSPALATAASNV